MKETQGVLLATDQFVALVNAGWSQGRICGWKNMVDCVGGITEDTCGTLAHLAEQHANVPAAKLLLATMEFFDACYPECAEAKRVLGEPVHPWEGEAEAARKLLESTMERAASVQRATN